MIVKISSGDVISENAAAEVAHIKDGYYYVSEDYMNGMPAGAVIVGHELPRGKLLFRYGAMGSSKTAHMLMVAFNYEERGQKVLVAKPSLENRDGELTIKSRIGLNRECITVEMLQDMDITEIIKYTAILVDEAQFCTTQQIDYLAKIADFLGVTVMCFGLRNDKTGHAFEGSMRLLEIADELTELKTVCHCGKKATFNARYNENGIVRDGPQIEMGANDSYISVCRRHFCTGKLFGDTCSCDEVKSEKTVVSSPAVVSKPVEEPLQWYDNPKYADYIVCAVILTQDAPDIYEGISRLSDFYSKVQKLGISNPWKEYQEVIEHYNKHGNFDGIKEKWMHHRPSAGVMSVLYHM